MSIYQMDGKRQYEFMKKFDYIREAGTEGEERAALEIISELNSFGVEGQSEQFPFEWFHITEARFMITEPFQKEYTVTGYGFGRNTDAAGMEAPFLYVENGDDISLSYAKDKIVMVNSMVRKEMLQKLIDAGARGFVSIGGTPIDEGPDRRPGAARLSVKTQHKLPGVHIHCLDAAEIVTRGGIQSQDIAAAGGMDRDIPKCDCKNGRNRSPGGDTYHYGTLRLGAGGTRCL